ncbi:Npun_F0296 family exosortase-dependent surface protein [Bradyrhizobium sp. HKCCYLS20291]|uniref:Npun_F0296 family exosortase-dependent surface protein n=1 Tax=Bradyrhizobium sp. HKCCYLS20291 TaxID=3420766 RepID=UPI003EB957AC
MNYAGKFDAALFSDGLGASAHTHAHVRLDAPPAHAPADAIVVPDAHFLFNAEFKRSGLDLVLSSQGRDIVLTDYFKGEKRAPLASPDGAHLTGDLVGALSGAVQVSQAGAAPSAGKVIGHVTKLQGTATAVRNGVSIILHNGDNVEKGDVVQSGTDSTLGITFIDGTVFGLSSNARMVLNEMVYDPNGSNNSSLISLVAGTISFVAGETAKHGDMKVDTPVATMGIRGTAVLVEIDFTVPGQGGLPDAKFQVLVEPDGRTGSYVLFDKTTLQPIAVVNQAGQQIQISNGVVNQSAVPLSPDIQKLINDVFSLKFTDNNTNPKTTTHFTDIGALQTLTGLKFADGTSTVPKFAVTDITITTTTTTTTTTEPPSHIPGPPEVRVLDIGGRLTTAFALTERAGQTGVSTDLDTVLSRVNFADINPGDQPTVSVKFSSFAYKSAQQTDVTGTLNALQLKDALATAVKVTVTADPTNKNYGSATLTYSVPDNAFDFLAAGEKLTLTYIVRVDNNFAPSNEYTEVPITITVTGTNDQPAITASVQPIAFAGGTSVPGGPLTSDDPTSGTLTFKDVDLTDTHSVSAKLSSAVLEGGGNVPPGPLALFEQALTASLAADSTGSGTGKIDWNLADLPVYVADFIPAGKTLTLTYTVTVTDSQGGTSAQTIAVSITGTDDPAVVWIATTQGQSGEGRGAQVLLWSDGANWATGLAPTAADDVIIITDQLHGLTPAFAVTIDADAFAKSVSLNDFGGGAVPQLDNHGTLSISGALTAKADAHIFNFANATITVDGSAQMLDQSVLHNAGTVLLAGGGEFGAAAGITNTGMIELSGGVLSVLGSIENAEEDSSGLIQVDRGASLTLDGGRIDGGTIVIQGAPVVHIFGTLGEGEEAPPQQPDGLLVLNDGAVISNGELSNFGTIDVSGLGNTFSDESVTNAGLIDVKAGGELTLGVDTAVDNTAGAIAVENAAKLTLTSSSVAGGTLTNKASGTISLSGHAAVSGGVLGNSGVIDVSGAGNALEDESVTNGGLIDIKAGGELALGVDTAVDNAEGAITVENAAKLTLTNSSIAGGTLTNEVGGTIALSGHAALTGGTLGNSGVIAVSGAGNALEDESVTNDGLIDVNAGGELALGVDTAVDNAEGAITVETAAKLTLTNSSIAGGALTNEVGGTIALSGHAAVSGGTLGNSGVIAVSGTGNALDDETITNAEAAAITIALGGALSLAATSIAGGVISSQGLIEVAGDSSVDGSALDGGAIQIGHAGGASGGIVNTGDGPSGPSWVPTTLVVEGGTTISDATIGIDPGSVLEVVSAAGATMTRVAVDNSGTVQVDQDSLLVLEDSTVTGGDLVNRGTVHVETKTVTTFDGVNIDNDGGVIIIDDAGDAPVPSTLMLDGNTILTGGTLSVGIVGTLEIAGGDVTLAGMHVENLGTFIVDLDSVLALVGTDVVGDGTLYIHGTLTASGLSSLGDTIINDGTIEVVGGTLEINGSISGLGTIAIDAGAILHFGAGNTQTIDFSGLGGSELVVDDSGFSVDGVGSSIKIAGLDVSDTIDLSTIRWDATTTTAAYDSTTGILTVSDADGDSVNLILTGADYSGAHFVGSDDHHGGTLITLAAQDSAPVIANPSQTGSIGETAQQTGASNPHSVGGTIQFTDADLTDRPTAAILSGAQSVSWTGADQTDLSGHLSSGQIATLEQALQLSQSGNTNNGTVDWTYTVADGALDFLGAGQTVKVTSTVTISDGKGGSATSTIVVTITGTNDQPVVTSALQTREIAEQAGTSDSSQLDGATGVITFTDADATDIHAVKVTAVAVEGAHGGLPSDSSVLLSWLSLGQLKESSNGSSGSQAWSFSAKDKVFDYLGVGQHVTLTYTVQINDGHGGVVDVPVSIKVNGAEDAPVITGETNPIVQTVILSERATVLASGSSVNAEGMPTETFDNVLAPGTSDNGRGHGSFQSAALHASFTASGDAGIVHGTSPVSAAPFMSGGADKTAYLSIGNRAQETITFDSAKNSFGLYWGSVDAYNSISFYNGTKLVASYTGSDVAPLLANGGQNSLASNGYVEFLGLSPFNKVVLASSQDAFELDNVSAGTIAGQPVKLASGMSGTLSVVDKDIGDVLTASVIGNGVVKYSGAASLPETVHIEALASAGAITFDSVTSHGGTEVLHWSYHPDAVNLDFLQPGDTLTVTYQAKVSDGHGTSGAQPLTITLTGNGATTVNGTDQNDNFVNVGGGVTILGKAGNDTFVFNPHFGSATIGDLDLAKDIVEIDRSLFASVEALVGAAQSANGGHDTVITDAAHDTLTLKGVTLDQFKAHHDGFHLV